MTELSEATWAVIAAYGDAPFSGRPAIAASLRAAVDAVTPEKTIEDIDYVHQSYVEGYMDALHEILIVANELEAK